MQPTSCLRSSSSRPSRVTGCPRRNASPQAHLFTASQRSPPCKTPQRTSSSLLPRRASRCLHSPKDTQTSDAQAERTDAVPYSTGSSPAGPTSCGQFMRAPPVPHSHPPASADASAQAPEAAWGLLLFELGTGLCRVFPCGVALLRQAVRCDLQFLAADASPRTVNGARGNVAGPSGNATTASLPSPLGSSRSCGASWATSRREYV